MLPLIHSSFRSSIFGRFVGALLQDKYNIQSDIHNLPMHLKCDVCNIPYKIVGKQETEKQVGMIVASYLLKSFSFRYTKYGNKFPLNL